MASPACVGVIPARYHSTRFPGKPLAAIAGKPMIQHVYERASRAESLSHLVIATDDELIAGVVPGFGGEAVLTSPEHPSGTDRLAEVARSMPEAEILVNIQGDEPLIAPDSIDLAVRALVDTPGAGISTLVTACTEEEYHDPNVVKAVLDLSGLALYFSRSPVPFRRGSVEHPPVWKHIGLYAYRRSALLAFAGAPPSPLEQTECLEQLRALQIGIRIVCAVSPHPCIGVDTPEDLARVERLLQHLP